MGARCIGLDVGTTKIAGVLLDAGDGAIIRVASRPNDTRVSGAHPWEHLQDPGAMLERCRAVLGELGPADSLCVTGQMHGVLYLDRAGSALSPLYTWLDARAAQPEPAGSTPARRLSALTGRPVAPGYGAATHFSNRERGLVPAGAAALCSIMDWISMRLAGAERPVTDPTIAASLGLYDSVHADFDRAAWEAAGLQALALPRVVDPGTEIGRFEGGARLYAPIADNQASFLGSVRTIDETLLLNVGTGGQASRFTESAAPPPAGIEARPFPGGGWLLVGATLCAGRAFALLKELIGALLVEFGGHALTDDELYERMVAIGAGEAERTPLVVDPRFNGSRADPALTGRIDGITLANFTPRALITGFARGIAEELHGLAQALEPGGAGRPKRLVASGNGVRKNRLVAAALAEAFGLPLHVPKLAEEAALGAALAAAVGAGYLSGYRAAGDLITYD